MPRAGLLLLPLLLCFGPETARSLNLQALKNIVDLVDSYGVHEEYAFFVSLEKSYCQKTYILDDELPEAELLEMQEAINRTSGLYESTNGHIVAARVNRLNDGSGEHAEWRLLHGGQNSPVRKLLQRTSSENRCLIFFSLNSPCVRTCLREGGEFNILDELRVIFGSIDNNAKAFVFRHVYQEDTVMAPRRLRAWLQLNQLSLPLVRCNNNACRYCFRNNNINSINCLGM